MKIKIKKLHPDARIPAYAHPGDAGLDLFSLETHTLQPKEAKLFKLGFALEFPHGYVALVKDKGSFAQRSIHSLGGVFDAGFRGEYNAHLINLGNESYTIEKGHKLAQLVILPIITAELEETDKLNDSSRGMGQFGSTGK
ncbi:MAG: dUTP diphosphatase [Candidatus Magasanikbacteria bacterium]|nr:dUTP diphosphatase [Candidatus Magasanikbacteria bacterium]